MLLGLQTWWLAAIATPSCGFTSRRQAWQSGCASGIAVAGAAIWLFRATNRARCRRAASWPAQRRARDAGESPLSRPTFGRCPERGRGEGRDASNEACQSYATNCPHPNPLPKERGPSWAVPVDIVLVLLTVAPTVVLLLARVGERWQTGMFFAAGRRIADAALAGLAPLVDRHDQPRRCGGSWKSRTNGAAQRRAKSRSKHVNRRAVAAASFIIVSMDAFRLDPTQQTPTLHSGNAVSRWWPRAISRSAKPRFAGSPKCPRLLG